MGLLKIASLLIFLASVSTGCPPAAEISPHCKCNVYAEDSIMSCTDLLCSQDLVTPISAISRHNSKIFSLTIYNSSLLFIPRRAFKHTGIELLRLDRTELMSFSDDDVAFEGLEDTLTELRSIAADYVAQWDWRQLRNLKSLSLIDVHSMVLESVDDPFPHLPALTALGIIRAKISYIVDKAFSDLPKLTVFNMQENDITEMKRNMFPDPAENLAIIDLRSIAADYVAQRDWRQLRNLKSLSLIDVHSMVLESVDDPFPHLPALTALGIIRAKISYIVDKAFSDLPKLTVFNMQENDITEMKRNMFPDPTENLAIIDLSYNKLSELPEDFFSNMPRLQDVHLINNNFQTIHEMPFSVAFKTVHLISMIGNPIRCDCRIRWLTDSRLPFTFNVNCDSPEVLKDKPIKDLEYKSLWCYK